MANPKFVPGDRVMLTEMGKEMLGCHGRDGTVIAVGVDDKYIKVLFDSLKKASYYPAEWFKIWRPE